MLRTFDISEQLRPRLEEVEEKVTDAYRRGIHEKEERISGYLTGLLSTELDGTFTSGSNSLRVDVNAFEARDEPKSGVDIGLRYQLVTDDFHISTGMLVQSKRFGKADYRLTSQCYKMLVRTQEAYIFTYDTDEISVVPALPVYCDNGTGGKFTKYYHVQFVPFFCRFFEGYFGDLQMAGVIDKPADAFPIPERVRYLVDVKAAVNVDEADFAFVDSDYFKRRRWDDQY